MDAFDAWMTEQGMTDEQVEAARADDGPGEVRFRTPEVHVDHEIEGCVECGHLHYDETCRAYVVCPVCDCVGEDNTPYMAEPVS